MRDRKRNRVPVGQLVYNIQVDVKTINAYDAQAAEYDKETSDFWERFPSTVIDQFCAEARGEVLDVGSGPGRDGLILKEKGLDVTCLDASKAMVELSSARGLESILGDFNQLPFPDNAFDGIWSYTALLHVPKSEVGQPLREITRVLKPGGVFGLGMIEGEGERYRESSGVNQPRWFSFYTKEELETLLEKVGFEVLLFESFKPGSKNYLNFVCRKVT